MVPGSSGMGVVVVWSRAKKTTQFGRNTLSTPIQGPFLNLVRYLLLLFGTPLGPKINQKQKPLGFGIIVDTILDVILELEMRPKSLL